MPVTYADVRALALQLPDVEETTSWGNPSLKAKGKLLAVHKDEDTLVLKVPFPDKDFLLAADPQLFWTTPHYDGYPAILVRMSRLKKGDLPELLRRSWSFVAAPRAKPRPKPKRR